MPSPSTAHRRLRAHPHRFLRPPHRHVRPSREHAPPQRRQCDIANREAMDESSECRIKYDEEVDRVEKCLKELQVDVLS